MKKLTQNRFLFRYGILLFALLAVLFSFFSKNSFFPSKEEVVFVKELEKEEKEAIFFDKKEQAQGFLLENSGVAPNDGIMCGTDFLNLYAYYGNSYLWNFASWTDPSLGPMNVGLSTPFSWTDPPVASIQVTENHQTPNDGQICLGDEVTLTASGGLSYEWSTGATTASITLQPLSSGIYTVTLTDGNGSTDEASTYISVDNCCGFLLQCQGDTVLTPDPSTCEAYLDNIYYLYDPCSLNPTITCTRSDGQPLSAPYAPGTTTVSCEGAIGGLVVESCSFQVTVEAGQCANFTCLYGDENHQINRKAVWYNGRIYVAADQGISPNANATISRFDGSGSLIWTTQLLPNTVLRDIIVGSDGFIYAVGFTLPYSAATNNQAVFVKCDQSGVIQFARYYSQLGREQFFRIVEHPNPVDPAYPFYIAGQENETNNPSTVDDNMLINVNAAGSVKWKKRYDLADDDFSRGLVTLANGHLLLTGRFGITGYLLEVDGDGLPVSGFNLSNTFYVNDGIQLTDGSFVLVGEGNTQAFMVKLDASYNLVSSVLLPGQVSFFDIKQSAGGQFYTAGFGNNGIDRPFVSRFSEVAGFLFNDWVRYLDDGETVYGAGRINLTDDNRLLYTDNRVNTNSGFGDRDMLLSLTDLDFITCITNEEGPLPESPELEVLSGEIPEVIMEDVSVEENPEYISLSYERACPCCKADFVFARDESDCFKFNFTNLSQGVNLAYLWNFGDGSPTSTLENPMHTFPQVPLTASYNVCLTVSEINGECEDTYCQVIKPGLLNEQGIICPPDVTVYTDPGQCSSDYDPPAPQVFGDPCLQQIVSCYRLPGFVPATDPYPVGTSTVVCQVTDQYGGEDACFFTVTVLDTVPPVIECPPDTCLFVQSGYEGAAVFYSPPFVSDNCPVTYTCTPPPGSFFPLGTTKVTCIATDDSGNESMCMFNVNVKSLNVSANPDLTICQDEAIQLGVSILGGTGSESCSWSPTTNLSDPNDCDPVFNSSGPGVYSYVVTVTDSLGCMGQDSVTIIVEECNAVCGGCPEPCFEPSPNLIYNGTFELGNTGFNSDLLSNCTCQFASYCVAQNARDKCTNSAWNSVTAPLGFGNFMVVDGNNGTIWEQQVNVDAGCLYTFSFALYSGISDNGTPTLEIRADGVPIASNLTSGSPSNWITLSTSWTPTTSALVTLSIEQVAAAGNTDYGIDDICLTKCTPKLTVEVGPDSTTICSFDDLELMATAGGSNAGLGYACSWSPAAYFDDPNSCNPTFSPPDSGCYVLTVVITDDLGCTATDSVKVFAVDCFIDCGNCPAECQEPGPNLVYNGGFELGDVGFGSGLAPDCTCNDLTYCIAKDARDKCTNSFWNSVTSPFNSGNYMVIDMDAGVSATLWTQQVTVEAGCIYNFSFANYSTVSSATGSQDLEFRINGNSELSVTTGPAPGWVTYSGDWLANISGTITLSLVHTGDSGGFQDYGIDNICFSKCGSIPEIVLGPDTTICQDQALWLMPQIMGGNGPLSCSWQPATNLSDPTICDPVFNSSGPGVYTYKVTVTDSLGCMDMDTIVITVDSCNAICGNCEDQCYEPSPNLIYNGTFELGDTGFNSDLPSNCVCDPSSYCVAQNSRDKCTNSAWASVSAPIGYGNYMVVDGSNQTIWEQAVNVDAACMYNFAFKLYSGISDNGTPTLEVRANGVPIASNLTSGSPNSWVTFSTNWIPATSGSVLLSIEQVSGSGNTDYGIDDICLTKCTKIIDVVASPDTMICQDQVLQLSAVVSGAQGSSFCSWSPASNLSDPNVCDPVFNSSGPGTYTYVITAIDELECIAMDTITIIVDSCNAICKGCMDSCYVSGPNLINNGTFELGNTGFTSSFPSACRCAASTYCVAANAKDKCTNSLWDPVMAPANIGNYMIIDANTGYSGTVWQQTVNVDAGCRYSISFAHYPGISNTSTQTLEFRVNGTPILIGTPSASQMWNSYCGQWVSDISGPVTVSLFHTGSSGSYQDYGVDDICFSKLTPVLEVATLSDTTICQDQALLLATTITNTNGPVTCSWSPGTNLDDPTSCNPVFNSSGPGIYTYTLTVTDSTGCTATDELVITVDSCNTVCGDCENPCLEPGENLVYNGTFELGNTGFTSDFNSNCGCASSTYCVAQNARDKCTNSLWDFVSAPIGYGNFLVIDGAGSNVTVWEQGGIPVEQGCDYNFSFAHYPGISNNSTQQFEIRINGVAITTINTGPAGSWSNYSVPWTALSNGIITLSIYQSGGTGSFQDFGIDDICFTKCTPKLQVAVAPVDTILCPGDSLQLTASVTGNMGAYSCSWIPAAFFDDPTSCNPVFIAPAADSYTLVLTVTDSMGCMATDTVNVEVADCYLQCTDCDFGCQKTGQNLVYNGGFELGNTGFSSIFNSNCSCASGTYCVTTNAKLKCNNAFWKPVMAPSSSGNFLVVDANSGTTGTIWSQTVNVQAGCTYGISFAHFPGISNNSTQILDFQVNGSTVLSGNPPASEQWNFYCGQWTATTTGAVTISLFQTGNSGSWQDYGVDNICFAKLGPALIVDAGEDITICQDEAIQLNPIISGANGTTQCNWFPVTNLSNPSICNPVFNSSGPGVYTYAVTVIDELECIGVDTITITVDSCNAVCTNCDSDCGELGPNLVYNGTFELGDNGFTSVLPSNCTCSAGSYCVAPNAKDKCNNSLWASVMAPSSIGNFLIVDGDTPNQGAIWQQNVNVQAGMTYQISFAHYPEISDGTSPVLEFRINNTSVSGQLSGTPGQWNFFCFDWVANTSGPVSASLNQVGEIPGSGLGILDYGIDDICISKVQTDLEVSIQAGVILDELVECKPFDIGTIISGGSGDYSCVWAPVAGLGNLNSCGTFFDPPAGPASYTLTVTVTDNVSGCTAMASITFMVGECDQEPGPCEEEIIVLDTPIDPGVYHAILEVIASAPVVVGDEAVIKAGQEVTLLPGTEILGEALAHILIEECVLIADPTQNDDDQSGLEEDAVNRLSLRALPNPFRSTTTVRFTLPVETGEVSLWLSNATGEQVSLLAKRQAASAGTYEYVLDGSNLAPGLYILVLQADGELVTEKIVLIN